MERHLLLSIGQDSSALFGVRFVSDFFTVKDYIRLTLFTVAPKVAQAGGYESLQMMEVSEAAQSGKGARVLAEAKSRLVESGFVPEMVDTKLHRGPGPKVQSIIMEGEKGQYDAVVLGKRGLVRLEEALEDSVSRAMVETLSGKGRFPLWVCRLPERGRKNVLLCVDGSDPSLRAADHVGFMLAREEGHNVHLFHIHDPAKEGSLEAEAVIDQARDVLIEAGLDASRITSSVRRGVGGARIILEECAKGNFAVVATGSSGAGRGFFKRMFMGSVSRYLVREVSGAVLWLCS